MSKQGILSEEVELINLFDKHSAEIMKTLRVCVPGTIQSYNPEEKTCTVQPGFNRVHRNGDVVPLPILQDCPVFTLHGGKIHVGFPIEKGDECLILFADSNIDAWFKNGGIQTPITNRRHDMSDGIVLVGLHSLEKSKTFESALANDEGGIADDKAKVAIKDGNVDMATNLDGILTITDTNALLRTKAGLIAIQNSGVDLLTILVNQSTKLVEFVAPIGDNSLIAIMKELITVLSTLKTTAPADISPTTVAALNALTTKLDSLSTKATADMGASGAALPLLLYKDITP